MRLDLAYGNSTEPVEIPDRNLIGVLYPNDVGRFQDVSAELDRMAEAAARNLSSCRRVLVVVNDYTRPTPTSLVLDALTPVLSEKELRILVGTGTHRAATEDELRIIFGPEFLSRHGDVIACHDSLDRGALLFKGKTRFSTDVWFNRVELWADHIIAINSVEPHYFAGYTGGRKSFLPGIAGYDTICRNHDMVVREGSHTFGLEGNPVHEDMDEAARMLSRPVFSIQVVLDRHHQPCSIHYGDLFGSFSAAAQDCYQVFAVPVREPADVVLSVLQAPYDINFYQSQRAVEFCRPALKERSVQITVSSCRDGIGNDGFVQVFRRATSPAELLRSLARTAHSDSHALSPLGWHKSARLSQIMESTDLYTVMNIEDTIVRSVFMRPFHSVQEALNAALTRIGPDARVYVIPDAGNVVPVPAWNADSRA